MVTHTAAKLLLALLACAGVAQAAAQAAAAEADRVTSLPKFDGDLEAIYSGCGQTGRCEALDTCRRRHAAASMCTATCPMMLTDT